MKIPLTIRTYSEGPKPFGELHVRYNPSRGRTVRGLFQAFVDTGSPFTFIGQTDALRLGIAPSGTPRTVRIGGSPVNVFPIKNMTIKVMSDDDKICDISMPEIGLAMPLENNRLSRENTSTLPSIIGVDLLKHHKLAFFFDVCNDISYLENP